MAARKTADWISCGQSIDQSLATGASRMEPTFPRLAQVIDTEGLVDLVEEIRLRTWARLNYAVPEERDETWHPIVLEEMDRKDIEVAV